MHCLESTEGSGIFLSREEPGSELCFGEVNPPLVRKRIGKKSDQRESCH